MSGPPLEICADTGETGTELLELLLPRPSAALLFSGCVRESLAAANSAAAIGWEETRAWDQPDRYIVDDHEGDIAIAQLVSGGMIGAVYYGQNHRVFDLDGAISHAPPSVRGEMTSLCRLPFWSGAEITAIFWTENGLLQSAEPWSKTYVHGGEIFRRELQIDPEWIEAAQFHYQLSHEQATTFAELAQRRLIGDDFLPLTEDELVQIVPVESPRRAEVLEALFERGAFRVIARRS